MHLPPQDAPKRSSVGFTTLGFALLAISTLLPLYLFRMAMSHHGGNQFGTYEMAMLQLGIAFIFISPLTATSGLYLVHQHSTRKSLRLLSWAASLPTVFALLFIAIGLALEMRPIPKYNPKNHQHFVGRKLHDIRSELDTRRSSGGSTSDTNGPYNYLSLRGMEIRFDDDGVVTEVKQGRME